MPGKVTACGGCGSGELLPFFDMGAQPLAEGLSEQRYPLNLIRCSECALVQLDYIVDPAAVFKLDHPYSTGNSGALRKHYAALAREIQGSLLTDDTVIDIGANDCTFLSLFSYPEKLDLVAVEPTDQIRKGPAFITRVQEPWTWQLAHKLHAQHGYAKVITACNVLAHVPDVHGFLDGVEEVMGPDSVFITENHDLFSVTDGLQVDTIYHEHLRYYTPGTLSRLLEDHGLRVERIVPVDTHGGSFRTYARTARGEFPARARQAAVKLHDLLLELRLAGKVVYGVGAATRTTPLVHFSHIADLVNTVVEVSTSDKIGTVIPGTQIPVIDEKALAEEQPEYALLFAWHMKDFIIPKLREAGYKGKFIIPLPDPKVIDG